MIIGMTLSTVASFAIGYLLIKMAIKDNDTTSDFLIAMGIGVFVLLGGGGLLGMIVKTFGIWGNSW